MSKTPPLDISYEANCLGFKVRRAARALGVHYGAVLAPHGLTTPQYSLLSVLARAGLRSLGELARLTTTDRTTLNRNLAVLEKRGLVESAAGVDRRTHRFVLTPDGRALQARAHKDWNTLQKELHTMLGKTRFERLHKDLDTLLAKLEAR
jgi:DNA-binding MarR family transcriptional regulator